MLERIFRVLVGFLFACLAAAFTKVLFAIPPSEIISSPPDVQADKLGVVVESSVFAAIWSLMFSFPFALVASAIGEWRRIRSWLYYVIVGVSISLIGLLTQVSAEQAGQPTIMNNYGFAAFICAGFFGGFVYWLFSGRLAGGGGHRPMQLPRADLSPAPAVKPAPKPAPPTPAPSGGPKKA